MAKLRYPGEQQELLGRLHASWGPFSLGWEGRRHEGNKIYYVRVRGRGRISGIYKTEIRALRMAVKMADQYQAYLHALGTFSSDRLRGFPN